jgi:hypothetical protein
MAYSREIKRIQNELQKAWGDVLTAITKMRPNSQIRPRNATDVFVGPAGDSKESKFDVAPVVFNVPERADGRANRKSNLYIAVSGWICFGDPLTPGDPRTTLRFATRVGYFRAKEGHLIHVYGVHYDMEDEVPGHPVFHAQMCSQAEHFATAVWKHFNLPFDGKDDLVAGLLRNVRIPTAQMDVFSVITQIGADHLVSETSSPEVQAAFEKLREACGFFVGAAGRIPYLNSRPATHCYRSTHWYKRAHSEVA